MRTSWIMAALASLAVSAGCGATCEEACENYAKVCEAELGAIRDDQLAACKDACANPPPALVRCTNEDEINRCIANAQTCEETTRCAVCQRSLPER